MCTFQLRTAPSARNGHDRLQRTAHPTGTTEGNVKLAVQEDAEIMRAQTQRPSVPGWSRKQKPSHSKLPHSPQLPQLLAQHMHDCQTPLHAIIYPNSSGQ